MYLRFLWLIISTSRWNPKKSWHTTSRSVVADTFTENLKEVLADVWSEHSWVLFLNRCRLVDPDLAVMINKDHGVVSIRRTEWWARVGHHVLDGRISKNISTYLLNRQTYRSNVPSGRSFKGRGRPLHGSRCGVWFTVNHCGGIKTKMLDRGEVRWKQWK